MPIHTKSHSMTSVTDHTAGNYKIFASTGTGTVSEVAAGVQGAPLLSNGVSALPIFGGLNIGTTVVTAAGITPVASDVTAWANNTAGIIIGTGSKMYLAFKGVGIFGFVELK